jgi:hypothetical protein
MYIYLFSFRYVDRKFVAPGPVDVASVLWAAVLSASGSDPTAGLVALAQRGTTPALLNAPRNDDGAVGTLLHAAARAGNVVWTQLLLWVRWLAG